MVKIQTNIKYLMPLVMALSLATPVWGADGQPSPITVTTAHSSRTVKVLAPQSGMTNTAEDIKYFKTKVLERFKTKVLERKYAIGFQGGHQIQIDAQWTDAKFAEIVGNSIDTQLALIAYIEDLDVSKIKSFQTFSVDKHSTYTNRTKEGTEMVTVLMAQRETNEYYYYKLKIDKTTITTQSEAQTNKVVQTKVEICALSVADVESNFYRQQVKGAENADVTIQKAINGGKNLPTNLEWISYKTGLSGIFTPSCPTCTQPTVDKGSEIVVQRGPA